MATHASERIRECLDAELTIILDASGAPSSRLRGKCVSKSGSAMVVQVTASLGDDLAVSVAGQIETAAGREPVLGKFRVRSCKLAGIGKYDVELMPLFTPGEQPVPASEDEVDHYEVLQ